MLEIFTTSPVCGAWMNCPPPTYIPMWPSPLKKTRSPGWSASRGRGRRSRTAPRHGAAADADLGEDVHHEPRAVEARRR